MFFRSCLYQLAFHVNTQGMYHIVFTSVVHPHVMRVMPFRDEGCGAESEHLASRPSFASHLLCSGHYCLFPPPPLWSGDQNSACFPGSLQASNILVRLNILKKCFLLMKLSVKEYLLIICGNRRHRHCINSIKSSALENSLKSCKLSVAR